MDLGSPDLHVRALEAASDDDRQWFEDHPGERVRYRAPHEHETCRPDMTPRCVPMVTGPIMMRVVQLGPGVRARAYVPMDVLA